MHKDENASDVERECDDWARSGKEVFYLKENYTHNQNFPPSSLPKPCEIKKSMNISDLNLRRNGKRR